MAPNADAESELSDDTVSGVTVRSSNVTVSCAPARGLNTSLTPRAPG